MQRKKKKKKIGNKSIICITTILVLNAMGVSYGSWNEGAKIRTIASTGNIDIVFKKVDISTNEDDIKISINENEEKDIHIEDNLKIKDMDDKKVKIIGEVIDDGDHEITIVVKNSGTIPVKLEKVNGDNYDKNIIIKPKKEKKIKIKDIYIQPGENDDIILRFDQCN